MGFPALVIAVLDQLTKWIVVKGIDQYETIPVIDGFFNLVCIRNRGMAFGLLNRNEAGPAAYFLAGLSILFIIILFLWGARLKEENTWLFTGLSFIIGGAVGNLIDRVSFQGVVDFLDFHVGSYHWPSFNLADSAITVGVVWVASILIFSKKKFL